MNFDNFRPPPPPHNGTRSPSQIGPPLELAPFIAKVHFYNDLIAGCLSLMINALLIFVITSRFANATRAFKRILVISTVFEILYSICSILTAPVLTAIEIEPEFSGLMIVNIGWQWNFIASQVFLMAAFVFLTQLIFISPWLYYFRWAQVCRKHGITALNVFFVILLNIILQLLTSACLCYSSIPNDNDISTLKPVADRFTNTTSAFLLLSYTRKMTTMAEKIDKILSIISAVSYVSSLVFSIFVMVFCSIRMNLKIRESKNTSNNLLTLQRKMNRVLLTQFFCPLIFIQLPFFYSVLGPIAGLSQGLLTDLLPLLFAWSPVVNTLVIFLLNSEVRNALIRKQTTTTSDVRRSFANES